MKKALIAMSGGVDSSLAAKIMMDDGFDCIGCTMKLYQNEKTDAGRSGTCCSLEDTEDARSVAYQLGIPYYVFNFVDTFRERVIEKFVRSYESGITPNPCIDCNRYLKFDRLYERAKVLGCDCIVTGHYARIEKQGDRYVLKKALDESKDQSYVLYSLTQEQLAHTVFPLGNMRKTEVRRLARESGFVTAAKQDSQDICFIPDGDPAAFLAQHTGKSYAHGFFVSTDGTVLGEHRGIVRYTVGQRRGLGLSLAEPMYVKAIDAAANRVILGREAELYTAEADAQEFHWISGEVPQIPVRCRAKVRYRQSEQPATVIATGEQTVHILFDRPQRAIAPGQAVVLYDGDCILGGGTLV